MVNDFVPIDFKVPHILETDSFRLRMLTVDDVEKDYDAVRSSIEYLQKIKPFGPNSNWPTNDITIDQDLTDIKWHQKEFEQRTSFAYTVMSLDESKCLGCFYIYPSHNPNYDAVAMMWIRQSEVETELDKKLFSSVKNWIKREWMFEKVAYPGRDISWEEFE